MKIRMKTTMAGPGGVAQAGEMVDVPDVTARLLVLAGYAVLVEPEPSSMPVEEATAPPAETAEAPAQRRRKK